MSAVDSCTVPATRLLPTMRWHCFPITGIGPCDTHPTSSIIKTGRKAAPKLVKTDQRRQSEALETVETNPDLRIVTEPGGLLIFSAAHMHATVPNTSGETRFSIDFRTVHVDDLVSEKGAANIDRDCSGTTIDDYLCGEQFTQLPDAIRTQYVALTKPMLA